MGNIYLMDKDSQTASLERIHCKNEDIELQRLLESNPNLLPGDQIDPEKPRKWILIKREMPVADPTNGASKWSIDMFFADQFGIPTLVECKRCQDPRARREVVAQMLEYAANGHHYWTKSEMRSFAEESAGGPEKFKTALAAIQSEPGQSVEDFFITIEQNLREAKMRLIFFLEDSANELRSLVDFMNRQMKDTEVLLVEARQYQHGENRIVVPWLFGFTEEARVAKRESRAETIRVSSERGEQPFWQAVDASDLADESKSSMRALVEFWNSGPIAQSGHASWGTNCIFVLRDILPNRGLFSLKRNGSLEMYFGYWDETKHADVGERQIALREDFVAAVSRITEIDFSEKQRRGYPNIPVATWRPKLAELQAALLDLIQRYG